MREVFAASAVAAAVVVTVGLNLLFIYAVVKIVKMAWGG